ncbi:UNVERIFIED_CONTAM: putative mitochondrial protein [Sesamum radiatum]|uniref:Mitochondrial protein n=1 Tax=Sesamum radiatum TaxID=300843 RepID=A0AAW2L2C6_SESRA
MNQELLKEFTADEVKDALTQMFPFKSPGPDGMSPIFYQRFWHIVGNTTVKCVLNVLNNHDLNPSLNFTHIVLIPKCSNPENISQFRPISLCNVAFKLASKCIANRVKPLLDSIISPSQSAFIPGRLITDNVLVAFEVNHFLRGKRGSKGGHVAIKMDMNKAYDRIEWCFLRGILLKIGFHSTFVDLIMKCVTSVSYAFMMNGSQFGFLQPGRGIRQGDPLSPYLFILCAEALSCLLQACEVDGRISGVAVARSAPKVSHLLFADDTLIFCQATKESLSCVRAVVDMYGKASGQQVNLQKSSIVFSRNTNTTTRDELAAILGVRIDTIHEKYLGLPYVVGRRKKRSISLPARPSVEKS